MMSVKKMTRDAQDEMKRNAGFWRNRARLHSVRFFGVKLCSVIFLFSDKSRACCDDEDR